MSKVSVGLRGWRFDESEIFTEEGEFKPLDEIPEDPRERLVRLGTLVEEPCDACYLIHGEEEKHRCRQSEIVYGEPYAEVLLCSTHEPDFLYWFREAGGSDHRGADDFDDRFHEWFAAGNRAPDGYAAIEHVDEDPENLPEPPDQREVQRRIEQNFEGERIDLRDYGPDSDPVDDEELVDDEALDDLDLSTEYPSGDR